MSEVFAEWPGLCPICRRPTWFRATGEWYRETLQCVECPWGSVPRERALMLVLDRLRPDWRKLRIHESSPAPRGVSPLFKAECPGYIATQYFPAVDRGAVYQGWRSEDLEAQTFRDGSFDLVITQDVFEHVFHPDRAHQEIYRTLSPCGMHIHTVPIYSERERTEVCARKAEDGSVEYLCEPEYHGNPVTDSGSLVTHRYGQDLVDLIAQWTPFSVEVVRFNDRFHGIVGAFTEVVVCSRTS